MKTVLATYHARLLAVLLAFARLLGTAAESNVVRVQFREVDTLFANPGQGWMSQQRSPRGADARGSQLPTPPLASGNGRARERGPV